MIKEIHEQPKAVSDTLNSVVKSICADRSFRSRTFRKKRLKRLRQIYIVACGSAYHVGGSSTVCYGRPGKNPGTCGTCIRSSDIVIRSSILRDWLLSSVSPGETADSLAAPQRIPKKQGVKTLGIVNVIGSSIAREADNVFYTLCRTGDCSLQQQKRIVQYS